MKLIIADNRRRISNVNLIEQRKIANTKQNKVALISITNLIKKLFFLQ
jgi:hypothetical protein